MLASFALILGSFAAFTISSWSLPTISTGVFGYPLAEAAEVSSKTIENFLSTDRQLQEVRLVFFQPRDAEVFLENQKFSE